MQSLSMEHLKQYGVTELTFHHHLAHLSCRANNAETTSPL